MARALESPRKARILLGLLVIGHLLLISRQVDSGHGQSLLDRAVFGLLSPVQRLAGGVVTSVADAYRSYVDLRHVGDENLELKQRVGALETELQRRQRLAEEATRLRALLDLARELPVKTIAAEVVARDGTPWFRSLTIDRGASDGVALNASVVCPEGVVGRIVALGPRAARVQTLRDRDSGLGAIVERSRVTGVVSGQVGLAGPGSNDLLMKYVASTADIQEGDLIVTSGLDRLFPKGLRVGAVRWLGPASGLFREVLLTPAADLDRLDQVLVLVDAGTSLDLTQSVRSGDATP